MKHNYKLKQKIEFFCPSVADFTTVPILQESSLMEEIDNIQTKLKFATFGKTGPQTRNRAKQAEAGEVRSATDEAIQRK